MKYVRFFQNIDISIFRVTLSTEIFGRKFVSLSIDAILFIKNAHFSKRLGISPAFGLNFFYFFVLLF